MKGLFNYEGPVMSAMSRLADLIWLNILTLICCIPVVTAGAALTALHYMTIKMVRKEECYITRGYFKSFLQNFKQATLIWLIILVGILVISGDYYILNSGFLELPKAFLIVIIAVGFLFFMMTIYVFPVLARFENNIRNTIKNAFFMSILNLPRTILIILIYAVPFVVILLTPSVLPIIFLAGLSVPVYVASYMFVKVFKKFEPQEESEEREGVEEQETE